MPTRTCKILVVDDNHDAAETLALLLRMQGHDVKIVFDPREAAEVAKTLRPEIAFLDIGMPHVSGYELARSLRASFPDIRLVAISGWMNDLDHRRKAATAGFDAHFTKPADLELLETVVQELCDDAGPKPRL